MKNAKRLSAVLLGSILFIAGILKLMDPVGTGLVMQAYLRFLHMGFLYAIAYPSGIIAGLCETILGAALITGIQRKISAIASLVILSFFTVLTLFILILNPEMDCGCFGEFIKLTHAQSFWKNIFLLALWGVAFIPLKAQEPTRKIRKVVFPIVVISVILFALYSALSLPLVDFTIMKPGNELLAYEELDMPSDATVLHFSDVTGQDADTLAVEGRVMTVSIYNPGEISAASWDNISETVSNAQRAGYTTLVLTASTPAEMESITSSPDILTNLYFADRKALMTLNRSNGGATYIADGMIISKWSVHKAPDYNKMEELMNTNITEAMITENNSKRLQLQAFLLYLFAIMLLL